MTIDTTLVEIAVNEVLIAEPDNPLHKLALRAPDQDTFRAMWRSYLEITGQQESGLDCRTLTHLAWIYRHSK